MHGGLFKDDGVSLDDMRKIDRDREPGYSGLMCDMLWSDPQASVRYTRSSVYVLKFFSLCTEPRARACGDWFCFFYC